MSAPSPSAEGNLAKTPFAHLLLHVLQKGLGGTLAVWPADPASGKKEDRIHVESGFILAARLSEPAGALDRGLLPIFTRTNAPFAFYDNTNLVGVGPNVLHGKVDMLMLIAASTRGSVRDDAVDEVLGRFGTIPLRFRAGSDMSRFGLNAKESAFLEVLRAEPAPINALIATGGLPERTARRFIYLLAITKAIEPYTGESVPRRTHPGTLPSGSTKLPTMPGVLGPASYSGPKPTSGQSQTKMPAVKGASGKSQSKMQAVKAAPPIEIPPLEPHSDGPPTGSLPLPDFALPGGPAAIVAQLPAPDLPIPDFASMRPAAAGGAPQILPNPTTKKPEGPQPPLPPDHLSKDHRAMWIETVERVIQTDTQDYFKMLGIDKSADSSTAKTAYFELVKKVHPDKLPPELALLLPFAQLAFRHITDAHETLSDPKKREAYLKMVMGGGGTPASEREMSAIVEATVEYEKATVLTKRRDYDGALQHLVNAIELNEKDGDYHSQLAWTLFQKHTEEDAPLDLMLEAIDKGLALHDKGDKPHYYRGMILRRLGRDAEAVKSFRRATEINPKNTDAVREVRLADMRSGKGGAPAAAPGKKAEEEKGLFGKLFGGKKP